MLKKIVGRVWQMVPKGLRVPIIRATQRKFTVSVGAVIVNAENKVLLLDHVLRPKGGWGIPGGFIDPDEQPLDALRREIREETCLELENIEMQWIRTIYRHVEIMYFARGVGEARVNTSEIHSLDWFTADEIPENMTETQKKQVRKILSNKNLLP